MNTPDFLQLDGTYGEGGGQLLRSALTLSMLTGCGFEMHAIRAKREKPGLRPQHLTAVRAAKHICLAQITGDEIGSGWLQFLPDRLRSGRFTFEVGTAGSVSLVLQTVFVPLSLAGGTSQVVIRGGTHVPWSPIYHYLDSQWLPFMQRLGFRAHLQLNKAGFYPRGGGEVSLTVLPTGSLSGLTLLTRGRLLLLQGYSGISNLEVSIATRQKHQLLRGLEGMHDDIKVRTLQMPSQGKGTFVLLLGTFEAGAACYTALGAPGKRAEAVADEAVVQIKAFFASDGCVDEFLADQLLIPLAFSAGESTVRTVRVTEHLLSNIWLINQFLPRTVRIEGDLDQPGTIYVSGREKTRA